MSNLNPYEHFLDGRPVEEILAATPEALRQVAHALTEQQLASPIQPGKWSPAQIITHLADCDLAFGFRLRQTLAEENHLVQPFDQDKWAVQSAGISAHQALAAFTALRAWNLRLIQAALPAHANKAVRHPERGSMTFLTIVETMAGHDLNHLAQLKKLVA
ncbi:MAG: DinB family protein [Terracidiphilus sp.]